jgi:hypothetical protein
MGVGQQAGVPVFAIGVVKTGSGCDDDAELDVEGVGNPAG